MPTLVRVGETGGRPSASNSAIHALCLRCGRTWPVDATSCPACDSDLGGETVLDDVHHVDTVLLGSHATSPTASRGGDTTPDGRAHPNEAKPPFDELPLFEESTGDQIDRLTVLVSRKAVAAAPPSTGSSSSNPPTRLVRAGYQHIELPSGSIVDEYEIDRPLGEGAMGVVYAARHMRLGRRVAIKVIAPRLGEDPQAMARFEREARALASLHHPNIVDVVGFGALADRRSYFVMEHLHGESLDERLERGRVPLDEALDVLEQIARALEAAHSHGVVHRDLKPANIFLCHLPSEHRSIAKLLDFGLAKLAIEIDHGASAAEMTQSGIAIGTPQYLSPEQARGPNVDGRTDLYALGCIAYELVLGTVPFPEAKTVTALLAAHLHDAPPRPRSIWPQVPAALDLLLFSLLAKDPGYRPSIPQVRAAIASVRSPSATGVRAMRAAMRRGERRASRARSVAVVGGAMLAGIVIGAAAMGSGTNGKPASRRSASVQPIVEPIPLADVDAGVGIAVMPVAEGPPITRDATASDARA